MTTEPKVIPIALRDFALPVPRTGNIESNSGYGRVSADGLEIHQRVQAKRVAAYADYRPEVSLAGEFDRAEYRFRIGGRIDGLFESDPPRIEEIKSSFDLNELKRKLARESAHHPYCLQLRTYGYLYWRQSNVMPKLEFHLVSTRSFASEQFELELDIEEYEAWFNLRLDELVEETRKSEARAERRKATSGTFAFPFDHPRSGQIELIQTIDESMEEKRRVLIQAPTGLGKTVGVLYPSLKEALSRGQRVIYVTPKNSQHAVAEDAVERFRDKGANVRSLTLTAKSKICFKNEPLCNPDYCEFARDHYGKVYENRLIDQLAEEEKLTSKIFREVAEKHEVCPFELQLDAAAAADVVICDYNYVFAPRTALGRIDASAPGQSGKPNLVVDEAHNLYSRAIDYYSPSLSTFILERMRSAVRELPDKFRDQAERLLDECILTVSSCRPPGSSKAMLIDAPSDLFHTQDETLRAFLSRYLDSDVDIQPKDVVLRLCSYWSDFTSTLGFVAKPKRPEFFTTFQPEGAGGTIKITCCDASEMLKDCYDKYEQVAAFSATLKPFDYYAKLSGLDEKTLKTAEFQSPFPPDRRKLLIIPEISTKYSDRERNYLKIAEAISRIAAVRPGNYFAFFPSFEFLERVMAVFNAPAGFDIMRQEREMRLDAITAIIDQLHCRFLPTLVFAVQGGVFSEGVDYPGDTVIGAFVVGPPLPIFNLEREQMREYYQTNYGAGFDYAYSYPAMAKAVQAAGRVIRSETDRGLIVLMDNRFIAPSYARSMPGGWFEENPSELVSKSILKDVADFWSRQSLVP